ncbi:membrane-associated protein, putative [Bodo saltans]|uniref:Membrane-associated protein, putative n=1 Tax=Bodo saltans TaxID=75058 RepID=A0A0S4JGK4_BODSA|nr:membrane-associated protein, putative [Bodo saltans]|eukprot:CUG88568.1 membrane-associated protein, putative [Bodo saltans]
MVMCDADSAVGGGVVDLGFVLCVDDDSLPTSRRSAMVAARSAVVSNIALLGVALVFLLLLAMLWSYASGGVPLAASTAVFCLPSSLMPVWTTTLPSTAAAAVYLFGRLGDSGCPGVDVVLGVCGVLMVLVPALAYAGLWLGYTYGRGARWFCNLVDVDITNNSVQPATSSGKPHTNLSTDISSNSPLSRIDCLLLHLREGTRRRWKWRAVDGNERRSGQHLQRAAVVLTEYRVLWYAALDSAVLVGIAMLAVGGGLSAQDTRLCRGSTIAALVLLVGQLATAVGVRPFTTLFSLVHGCATLALTCLSVLGQLLYGAAASSSDSTSGMWLVTASAVCDLAVVGVSALRMVLDVVELVRAVRRRYLKLRLLRSSAHEVPALLDVNDDDALRMLTPSQEDELCYPPAVVIEHITLHRLLESVDDLAMLHQLNKGFWDESGAALGVDETVGEDHGLRRALLGVNF